LSTIINYVVAGPLEKSLSIYVLSLWITVLTELCIKYMVHMTTIGCCTWSIILDYRRW